MQIQLFGRIQICTFDKNCSLKNCRFIDMKRTYRRIFRINVFFLRMQLFRHRYDISVPLCFFLSSLNSIVIYVFVSSRADVAFSARRSRSSLKEYLSCLFLRASSREAVNTYGRSCVLEGPRGWWRRREPPQKNMVRVS